jgi:hypothetical protein
VVGAFENNKKQPGRDVNMWKTFAVYSGATLQFGTLIVVFGYLGNLSARKWNIPWLMPLGVIVGVVAGGTGLAFLAKQLLGDHDD